MSAVINTPTERNPEDGFLDSQMLPPQERGVTFEALYFSWTLAAIFASIFNADRLTLYADNG